MLLPGFYPLKEFYPNASFFFLFFFCGEFLLKKYLISFLSCPLHSHNSSFAIFSIWFTLLLLFFNLFCTRLWSLQKIFKAQLDIFKSCFDQFRIQIITLSPSLFFTYNLYRLFSEEICVLSWSTSNSYIDLNWSLSFQIIILCTSQSIQSNCYFLVYILGFSYCFNIFLIFLIFHPLCYIHVIIRRYNGAGHLIPWLPCLSHIFYHVFTFVFLYSKLFCDVIVVFNSAAQHFKLFPTVSKYCLCRTSFLL